MRRLVLVWAVLVITCAWAQHAYAQKAVVLVRHAERADDSRDAVLSEAGRARAAALTQLLRDTGIAAIYTSQFKRNIQTAEPLAAHLKIKPFVVPADDVAGLVQRIRKHRADEVVLVVGHSDTLPDIIAALGCKESIDIQPGEYDNLFVVFGAQGQPAALLRLRF